MGEGDGEDVLAGSIPGVGGVTRGRADAEMIWGEESPEARERFAARALPPATALDPERLVLAGVGATAPTERPVGEASSAAPVAPSLGGASWRRRLAPRHRDAVKTFFSDPAAGASEKK